MSSVVTAHWRNSAGDRSLDFFPDFSPAGNTGVVDPQDTVGFWGGGVPVATGAETKKYRRFYDSPAAEEFRYFWDRADVLGDDEQACEEAVADYDAFRYRELSPFSASRYYDGAKSVFGIDYGPEMFAVDAKDAATVAIASIMAVAPVILSALNGPPKNQAVVGGASAKPATPSWVVPLLIVGAALVLSKISGG